MKINILFILTKILIIKSYDFFNENNYECSKTLLKSYDLEGLDFYDNKNLICKNIKKNCCSLKDQLTIYDRVIKLKNYNEKNNFDLIKNIEKFKVNFDDFFKLDFNKIKNEIVKQNEDIKLEEVNKLLNEIKNYNNTINKEITEIYLKNKNFKDIYKLFEKDNKNEEFKFHKDFLNSLTEQDIELLNDYNKKIDNNIKILNKTCIKEIKIDFEEKKRKVHDIILKNKKLQKELFYYDFNKNNKFFFEKVKRIFEIKLNSFLDYFKIIKINYSSFYNYIDILNENFFCLICDHNFLKYINFDKNIINVHELTCDNLITRYLYLSQIKIKIIPYINKLKTLMNLYLNKLNEDENDFDYKYYDQIINGCFKSLKGFTLITEDCLKFCEFYRLNYSNDIFFEDNSYYGNFNKIFKNFIIKYNTGSLRLLQRKKMKYEKHIDKLINKDFDYENYKNIKKKEEKEINNIKNFSFIKPIKLIDQIKNYADLKKNYFNIKIMPTCDKPINISYFKIKFSIIGYKLFNKLKLFDFDKKKIILIKNLIKLNKIKKKHNENFVKIDYSINKLIHHLNPFDIYKFTSYINLNFKIMKSKIDTVIENDDLYEKYTKIIEKADSFKKDKIEVNVYNKINENKIKIQKILLFKIIILIFFY